MARMQKLKVYRTPAGFHDAYVAAPSQKAALEAWGTDTNLFARGAAEIVTDEALARAPLAEPGKVIKRLRGSAKDHFDALPGNPPKRTPKDKPPATAKTTSHFERSAAKSTTRRPEPKPRPSRAALDDATRALDQLAERQRAKEADLSRREQALARERRILDRQSERERKAAEAKLEREWKAHSDALARWLEDQDRS